MTEQQNADARPEDTAAQAPVADQAPAAEPTVSDVDDLELAQAIAAAQAEEAEEGKPEGEADQQQGADPASPAPVAAAPTDPKTSLPAPTAEQQPIMVPKARLDEALSKTDRAAQEAAYWRGVAEARAQPAATPAQPTAAAPAAQTPEQKLTAIAAETDALAAKFDAGEITMADFKRAERDLVAREHEIREELLLTKVRPNDHATQQSKDQLYLASLTADLEKTHPWVNVFDQVATQADWRFLEAKARENLAERGVDMSQGELSTFELRREIATLADVFGPSLIGAKAQARGIQLPGQQQPITQQQQPAAPGLSPQAKAMAAKLALQAAAPPNISAMSGSTGAHPGAVSDSQIEAMSEDEIGALPDATRKRLLGIT